MKIIGILLFLLGILFLPHAVYADGCAVVQSVTASSSQIQPNTPFSCNVTVDADHAGSSTIACGVSFDGKYPENYCPSDTAFGAWQGSSATFNCSIDKAVLSANPKSIELVAYDFRSECQTSTGRRTTITASTSSSSSQLSETSQNNPPANNAPQPRTYVPNTNGGVGQGVVPNNPSTSISELLQKKSSVSSQNVVSFAQGCLANKEVYQQAAAVTGVAWQVLAGIHYREGNCGKNQSLVSGRSIGSNEPDLHGNCSNKNAGPGKSYPIAGGCAFHSLLDTAIYSGNHLKSKIGANPATMQQLVLALSRYNGGGNANCGKTPFASCPALYPGEDDTYVMNLFDERHARMFVVYCADYTRCQPPKIDPRPGTLTISSLISSQ